MGSKLSHDLIDLGFFSALGTSEHPGVMRVERHVGRGIANTCDSNNGVTVVYDEDGRPWILKDDRIEEIRKEFQEVITEHRLTRGAYVPHSNDGGYFVREILPKL